MVVDMVAVVPSAVAVAAAGHLPQLTGQTTSALSVSTTSGARFTEHSSAIRPAANSALVVRYSLVMVEVYSTFQLKHWKIYHYLLLLVVV